MAAWRGFAAALSTGPLGRAWFEAMARSDAEVDELEDAVTIDRAHAAALVHGERR